VEQRPMGHHGALGPGRRPGGVEQLDEIAVLHPVLLVHGTRFRGHGGDEVFSVADQRLAPQVAQFRGDPVDLRFQGRIHEHDGGLALGEQIGELVAGRVEVHGDVDQPGPCAPEEQREIRIRVLAVGRDAVTGPQTAGQEARGDSSHGEVQLAVGPGALLEHQSGAVGSARCAAAEDLADGAGELRRRHGCLRPSPWTSGGSPGTTRPRS
jgi:hypothetical protein